MIEVISSFCLLNGLADRVSIIVVKNDIKDTLLHKNKGVFYVITLETGLRRRVSLSQITPNMYLSSISVDNCSAGMLCN